MKAAKNLILVLAIALCNAANAQWGVTAYSASPKICSAYKCGKFSGHNGRSPRFIRKGQTHRAALRRRAARWGR
jgi:hypothetical protein